jgi:peptidoglycan L-alanyl-D-glutamate endopeptidase CwlK
MNSQNNMEDKVTIERIKLLHPKLRDEALVIFNEINEKLTGDWKCRFSSTLRTFKEQEDIYAIGRTKPGSIRTKAKPGYSFHNYGLAIDIVLVNQKSASWDIKADFDGDGKADWLEAVAVFKKYGWEWGGDWKFFDAPHFQKAFGKSIKQLFDLYSKGNMSNNYVNI